MFNLFALLYKIFSLLLIIKDILSFSSTLLITFPSITFMFRLYNDFFSGLFHDLPEAVTRDIISPVKQATDELPFIVKKIEDEIVRSELVPLMDESYVNEILYFINEEFANRIEINGKTIFVDWDELNSKYNKDSYNPIDGKTVRLSDHLSAFIEAHSSIKHGITSEHLQSGKENLLNSYEKAKLINGINIRDIFENIIKINNFCKK